MGNEISVNEFRKIIREEVEGQALLHGLKHDTNSGRGQAFQYWVANIFTSEDHGFETDPEESLLFENDLKADIVLEDNNRQHLLIAQTKFRSVSDNPPIDETEVNDFFHRHEHFLDSTWVRKHGSQQAIDFLSDYADKIQQGYTVELCFVSTGTASERIKELEQRANNKYKQASIPVKCRLLDFLRIKELYIRTKSLEDEIPLEVRIMLPEQKWIEKKGPYPTVVAIVKGNALRDLYKRHKEALFAQNIRGYLGSRGLNAKIIETAETRPSDFFYFNNGVSAICTRYEFQGNEVIATNCQIINGAQTLGALAKAPSNSEIEVLFRLTKAESVKTEKGMNIEIIRYNNSQNIIKTSDFHSNDPIQLWLEQQFQQFTPEGEVVPKLYYKRRRGPTKRGKGQALTLEELAKIRYAFLNEPTVCHASPKDLWTPSADKGQYEKAFGVDGELPDYWSKEEFRRCLLATALYLKIAEKIETEGASDPRFKRMKRFRYHALSLAGIYWDKGKDRKTTEDLLKDSNFFMKEFNAFWSDVRRILIDSIVNLEEQGLPLNSYVRNIDKWQSMSKRLSMYITRPI